MYFLRLQIILILIWAFFFKLTKTYNYCGDEQEKKLCRGKPPHIICKPESVPKGGELVALAPMTRKLKRIFVERHNECRDKLASGEQDFKGGSKFPKATRMREMLWDDELAFIAGQHASRCKMFHDKCRSTERFPMAGQNLYIQFSSEDLSNMTEAIIAAVDGWWGEATLVDDGVQLADKFPEGVTNWKDVGHFTAIANERNSFVGCGIALCKNCDNWRSCIEVTCDYAPTNIQGDPMYKKGEEAASECGFYESVPSETYRHLCVNTGKLFNDEN